MARADAAPQGDLPDVNVWLALLNAQHPHHARARTYWEQNAAPRTAFCRVTMLGLLRLSTSKLVMGDTPYSTEQAWLAYQTVASLPEVFFAVEPLGIEVVMQQFTAHAQFKQTDWTDAYLAAFAQSTQLRMVTFDKGFKRFAGGALLTL